jgi:hypothetical protein
MPAPISSRALYVRDTNINFYSGRPLTACDACPKTPPAHLLTSPDRRYPWQLPHRLPPIGPTPADPQDPVRPKAKLASRGTPSATVLVFEELSPRCLGPAALSPHRGRTVNWQRSGFRFGWSEHRRARPPDSLSGSRSALLLPAPAEFRMFQTNRALRAAKLATEAEAEIPAITYITI